MRQVVVGGELDALGVDHQETKLIGLAAHEQADEHIIDGDGFTGARTAGDEEVGAFGEVDDQVAAGGELADGQGKGHLGLGAAPHVAL